MVDVKKVLVIGSGGLAIGQAGEFDYSGMSRNTQCGYVAGGILFGCALKTIISQVIALHNVKITDSVMSLQDRKL